MNVMDRHSSRNRGAENSGRLYFPFFSNFGRRRRHSFFFSRLLALSRLVALSLKVKTGWPPAVGLPVLVSVF